MRLGIYGGTFNPVHKGHIHYAREALSQLNLDKVLLVVGAIPPHKEQDEGVTPRNRLDMCRLAVKGQAGIEVCDLEVLRGGKSYTVDTLYQLKVLYPDAQLFLLLGTDMYLSIESWRKPDEILRMATVVGAPRLPEHTERLLAQQAALRAKGYETEVLDLCPVEISSTEVREGETDQLDPLVRQYIGQNGLYGNEKRIPLDLDELTQMLRQSLSKERFAHTLNVANEALRLAEKFGADGSVCYLAGLLHDSCKEWNSEQQLKILSESAILNDNAFIDSHRIWHGFAAAQYIQSTLSVYNTDIIDAVRYHSTARKGMALAEKIIYMADLICADRRYPGVEQLRAKAYRDLDGAMLEALQFIIGDLVQKGLPVLPDTIAAYHELLHTAACPD